MASQRNCNGKRAIETIDLTGNDEVSLDPQPRKISRSGPTDSISQSQTSQSQISPSQREAWDDEDDADDILILSQDGNLVATESYELYGT